MNKFDKGWVTGLIEGEGCFDFLSNPRYPSRYLRLRVGSTDRDVLERLCEILGGTIHEQQAQVGHKRYWRLSLHGGAVDDLIDEIYPHLSKRRRAAIDDLMEEREALWAV